MIVLDISIVICAVPKIRERLDFAAEQQLVAFPFHGAASSCGARTQRHPPRDLHAVTRELDPAGGQANSPPVLSLCRSATPPS
jgi:hypothetical protein